MRYIYMSHIFFIHSSGDGHWVISITWVVFLIVNNAAIKVVCVYFQLSVFLFVCFFIYMPMSGIAGSYGRLPRRC